MLAIEDWAEIRRWRRSEQAPIKAIARVVGLPPIRLLADRGGELRLPFSAALDESWMGEMALTGG